MEPNDATRSSMTMVPLGGSGRSLRRSPLVAGTFIGRFIVLFAGLMVLGVVACRAQSKPTGPYVVAADEKDAQSQIRHIEERWELWSPTKRVDLKDELETFVRLYPSDPSSDQAKFFLAQIALYQRRFADAVHLLQPLIDGEKGRLRDEARLAMASVEIREGKLDEGLARLAPLEGKLLSASAIETFYHERISAALAARRWRLAVDSMRSWLKDRGRKNESESQRWIERALGNIPAKALFRTLHLDDEGRIVEPQDPAERFLTHRIIERVAREALAAQDSALSRDLLAAAPIWLKTGEQGEALLRLSSFAREEAQIAGRVIGLLLGGESKLEKSRNVRVAAGALRALHDDARGGVRVRYVTAEDRGSTENALSDLSGQGATFVLGGVDESSSREALSFARNQGVVTLVMNQPTTNSEMSPYGFVVGVSEAEQVAALRDPMLSDDQVVVIGGETQPCENALGSAAGWGVGPNTSSIIFLGDAGCLHTLSAEIRNQDLDVGVGLWAADGPFPKGRAFRYLSVGSFPKAAPKTADVSAPSEWDWYYALGYDTARLAMVALSSLPDTVLKDRKQVREYHTKAAFALLSVKTPLLTSAQRGFDDEHRIERALSVRRVEAIPSSSGSR